jgi:hypothetical protein
VSAAHAVPETRSQPRRSRRRPAASAARAPGPKYAVSGAGRPLEPSVRRDLEERLGHDLGRVRLHTDRAAGAVCDLLGAAAVTVGTDVFFGAGAFQPGTAEGQRLIAHELLHTIQRPHGPGALAAGRDHGAVSLAHGTVEHEAEAAAGREAEPGAVAEVAPAAGAPAWLRYATPDADRARTELDPATLPDRLAADIVRSLRGDPADWSKRTRRQLERLPADLVDPVLDRLETRLLSPEYERVLGIIDDIGPGEPELDAHQAPVAEPDAADELRVDRESAWRREARERAQASRPGPAPGPETDQVGPPGAPGSTPQP